MPPKRGLTPSAELLEKHGVVPLMTVTRARQVSQPARGAEAASLCDAKGETGSTKHTWGP